MDLIKSDQQLSSHMSLDRLVMATGHATLQRISKLEREFCDQLMMPEMDKGQSGNRWSVMCLPSLDGIIFKVQFSSNTLNPFWGTP